MGDLVKRRQLILLLALLSSSLTIGLAITNNLRAFELLSFLVGVFTVVPQILLPLVADLTPPERRATAISIMLSAFLFGILVARVLAGVIANFTSWRVVYYMAVAVQYFVLVGVYLIIPDYPAKNQGLTYFNIMITMAKYAVTEPLVIQASIVNLASSACYSSFWVTLTFLLGDLPYKYSTLVIGLFGLIGMLCVAISPFLGHVIDQLVPWHAAVVSTVLLLVFQAIRTGAGGVNIAAVVIAVLGLDVFRQTQQVSLMASVFTILADSRSRVNAILIISFFVGQVMGTAVGTKVFIQHGWRAAAAVSMAWYGLQLAVLLVRGPHVDRHTWFGYEGGLEGRKGAIAARQNNQAAAVPSEKKMDGVQPPSVSASVTTIFNVQEGGAMDLA